ncbi:protein SEC13 homolog [Ischnura elegans]|uniref:protein SEC13 homolog n=1 Tax=Ischnura elegans TaxID=197161 RepID=UPI001ED87469|nr:protein SEC13 homolog [Ischnura elegans]
MVSLVTSVDTAHEDVIHDAELDFNGVRLATCSSDHAVKIHDLRSGTQRLIAELKGHDGPVWQVAWSHQKFGNLLASCSYDRKVIIWKETNQWAKIYEHSVHESSVNSIRWAPSEYGLILACGSSDGAISILTHVGGTNWEFKKIANAHTIGCNAVTWCPATYVSLSTSDMPATRTALVKRIVSGGCDNLVKIWREDDDRWVEETKLEGHSDWVRDVAWAKYIGLPRTVIASCSQDRRVIIWSSDNFVSWSALVLKTFEDVVWSVSWSITGHVLAVSGGDNKVTLWKENEDGRWNCINDLLRSDGSLSKSETMGPSFL